MSKNFKKVVYFVISEIKSRTKLVPSYKIGHAHSSSYLFFRQFFLLYVNNIRIKIKYYLIVFDYDDFRCVIKKKSYIA